MTPNFRNLMFWLSDWLKGAKIRRHHNAITKINQDHDSEYAITKRNEYLSELLRHCQETVPFYKNLGVTDFRLENYPVTNKNVINSSSKSFASEKFINRKTFKASTSGSTGTPFTVFHDVNKKKRHGADVRFFWETVGHPFGTRFFYLRVWTDQNRKGKFLQWKQNFTPIDIRKMGDSEIENLLEKIKTTDTPISILGYASAFDRIVKFVQQNPSQSLENKVIAIVTMSEALNIPTKKGLSDYFNCPVVSRYANMECGMIAQQTSDHKSDFLLNLASYHIEILDLEADVPAKKGQPGRIIVTDLFNKAMPLIRYDTGDIGVLGKVMSDTRTQYVLKKVEGRKMDTVFDTKNNPISSFIINNNMWKYSTLNQYQFIQVSEKTYLFKLNTGKTFLREDELINEFKGYLGNDADIKIEYVNEIPLLSSGKRKKVLNRMKKKISEGVL
ncbi:hypothetical protein LCGC14_0745680 [marine sediment metagenome]|uniref:CoF synthetase n=2 Tax=root TaxID=1 RepID=A0A831QRH8_9FLAO|nr:CoF synthetase [Pricia antarctica]